MYHDEQLNQLESQVELSNQNVIAAMARYRQARDQVRIAHASFFPTVTATPAITAARSSSTFVRSTAATVGAAPVAASGTVVDYAMPVDV